MVIPVRGGGSATAAVLTLMCMPQPSPFSRLHHIFVVIPDINAAQRFYEPVGISPWQLFSPWSAFSDVSIPSADFETLT